MMENEEYSEEKEDLLIEVTESDDEPYEKEEIDYYIEKKILDFIQNEKTNSKSNKKTIMFIAMCFFLFLSSSVLIVALPIYQKYSSLSDVSTYSKLVTLSLSNVIIFVIAHIVGVLAKRKSHASSNRSLFLGDVLKAGFLLSIGTITLLWLTDGNYVSCHLKDPLKGCCIVFSFLFYFLFSRKKMSLERTFCAITIIVGVFVSVDFGICDKFQCNGNTNLTENTPKFHFLYVILYLLAHGVWVLHFTFIEVCWTASKDSASNLNVSVLSNFSSTITPGMEIAKPSIRSLSIICPEDEQNDITLKNESVAKFKQNKKSFIFSKFQSNKVVSENSISTSMPSQRNQLSVPNFKKFPLTSTPNNEADLLQSWTSGCCYNVALWQHVVCCLIILALCWVPTVQFFHNTKEKLPVEVISEVVVSFSCHIGWSSKPGCSILPNIAVLVSVSYVVLILSSIEVLKTAQSAVTVVSVMMPALPFASLFWSLFQINEGFIDVLEFDPEITGEAVCAVLGLPIIGIGIVLLVKSHIREFKLGI